MKKLLLLLFISLLCFQIKAQDPDPNLFRTWYLTFVQLSDMSAPHWVSSIDPPISPNLRIDENLDFNGVGACNSFNGKFIVTVPEVLASIEFYNTNEDCGFPSHNLIEGDYFIWMSEGPGPYIIDQDANGMTLTFYNFLFGAAIFQDYPLSSSEFNLKDIRIYPNPVKETLRIDNTSTTEIISIKIYDVLGRLVLTEKENVDQIDVSHLDSGVLFVEIETDQGVITKKIIKE
jgi:hypothetical protein